MLRLIRLYDEHFAFPLRWGFLVDRLSGHLEGNGSILDVGASNGQLARLLSDRLAGAEFTGVDTHVQPGARIPLREYDGRTIPFADNTFDCVMLVDVLHHARDPLALLREAKRVSRKKILIKDHYWDNKLDFLILQLFDYIGNRPYGIECPYNFLKIDAWKRQFEELKLKEVRSELFRFFPFDPCKHVIYALEK